MPHHHGAQPGLSSAHVLVVEDDPILCLQLQRLVGKLVGEVRTAPNGAEGLRLWHSWRPDLVLTDIMMPVMDGLEMSRVIKEMSGDTQIVVITSSADVAHLRQALEIGIDRYVLKPVDEHLLADAMNKSMRDVNRLRELRLARLVFEAANEGMVVTDISGVILTVNPAFCEISGYHPDEVVGKTPAILNSGLQDPEFYRNMWESLKGSGRWAGEIVNRRKNGEIYPEWLSIVAVEDSSQRSTRYVGLFSDITDRKREEDKIRRLAHYDALTGLPNRILFTDHLRRALARNSRNGGMLAVLYLDLDRFKPVNDQFGHDIGDQVLVEAARRMQASMRTGDTVSRRGGDEFVALLESSDAKNTAALVSRKLIHAVSQPYDLNGMQITIGASIGVAVYPDDGDSADALLTSADGALYAAKQEGRGDFRFVSMADQRATHDRLSIEEALRQGIRDDAFELHYLPEISLADSEVTRFEALLRFRHPIQGMLEPHRFLEVAERLGLTPELGSIAIGRAARTLVGLGSARPGLTIDLTPAQLASLSDPEALSKRLAEYGLEPGDVAFDFSEDAASERESVLQNLLALARAGFRLTLDHFGAGFCSFGRLQQLPLSAIKIDLFFVEEIDTNPQSRELVAAMIAFAKRLGIRAVAEGVSSGTQLAFLRDNGCDTVQGSLFGQPLREAELATYLRERPWRSAWPTR